MSKRFVRNIEDFTCENCGKKTTGNGYTNHCPNCLFSKHVDINPGDRQANCGGMMEPIGVECSGVSYVITFKCRRCGATKRNKAALNDNFETILETAKTGAARSSR